MIRSMNPLRCLAPFVLAAVAVGPTAAPATAQRLSPTEISDGVRAVLPAAMDRYRSLLSLPSDAHDTEAMNAVVEWLERELHQRDFTTRRLATPGAPLLFAERGRVGPAPTVLIYLQADGQPVDPPAWDQANPWSPVLKAPDGAGRWRTLAWDAFDEAATRRGTGPVGTAIDPEWRVFARSASDSKGPIAQLLAALDVLAAAGVAPDFRMKIIIDTEEELGSPHLADAVERHRDLLAADMLVIFDGPPHVSGLPTLTFGARGIATVTLTAHGPRVPQHSGHYGNYAPNPAQDLARILASLKDADGRVTLPGWYDGVVLDDATRAILRQVPDDEDDIRRRIGIAEAEAVAPTLQEALQYPSLNIRGLRSAWVGNEVRTIIPSTAIAELDIRLVRESEPERLLAALRAHIEGLGFRVLDRPPDEAERLRGPRVITMEADIAYAAFRTDFDSEPGRWLTRALRRLNGEPPIRIRTGGGSIPIAPFVATLGVPAVIVPTVNPDNNQHSPNENLRMADFVAGIRTMVAVLQEPPE